MALLTIDRERQETRGGRKGDDDMQQMSPAKVNQELHNYRLHH